MPLDFQYLPAAGALTDASNGTFIPVGDLPGLTAAELGEAAAPSKVALALMNQIFDTIADPAISVLGWSATKPNPVGVGSDLLNQAFNFTVGHAVRLDDATSEQIYFPTSGANANVGRLQIVDVFPNRVADPASAPGAGVYIPFVGVTDYGAGTGQFSNDDRHWFEAVIAYIVAEGVLRSAADASAIVTRARGSAVGFAPPANWTQTTDPVSGYPATALPKLAFFNLTYSITLQLKLNQSAQTFDVNHVTA